MTRKCCICEKQEPFHVVGENGLTWCAPCSLSYLREIGEPKPDEPAGFQWSQNMYAKWTHVYNLHFCRRIVRIKKWKDDAKTLLDMGAKHGFWVDFLQNNSLIESIGMEPNEKMRVFARIHEVRFWREPLLLSPDGLADLDKRFDVITCCDVLDHIEDPNQYLEDIKSKLAKDGLLYLQVPDVLDVPLERSKLFKDGPLNLPQHIWHFNLSSISALLEKHGFFVREWWSGIMDVVKTYEAGGPDKETVALWSQAIKEKRGNRISLIAKLSKPCT